MDDFGWAMLQKVYEGSAPTPFQYRILVPGLMRLAAAAVHALNGMIPDIKNMAFVFTLVAILAYIWGGRRLLFAVCGKSRQVDAYSMILLLVLPFTCVLPLQRYHYISDIPSIAFFCWGIFLIHQRKLGWFYPLYIIATLNRETSCFLTVIFFVTQWGNGRRLNTTIHCVVQMLIWVVIKLLLWHFYIGNISAYADAGGVFRGMLAHNIRSLLQAGDTLPVFVWFQLLILFGGLWLPVLINFRSIANQFVLRLLLVLPVYLFGMLLVGDLYEVRIFGEMIPVILLGHCQITCFCLSRKTHKYQSQ